MPINSNQKGKAAEREVAKLLRDNGYEARRGQQFSGGGDSPDVVHSMSGFHIEVKRVEKLSLYSALDQAEEDRRDTDIPVVFHRRSRKPWTVVMYAEDFLELVRRADK